MTQNLPSQNNNIDIAEYRPNVGIALFNAQGLVLIAERLDNPGYWQMPQGGINPEEEPEAAVFRELEEELGTRKAEIIALATDWICYDFPPEVKKKIGSPFKGQRQKWIALRFLGTEADIHLDAHEQPEFSRWKWVPLAEVADYAVPFKRDVYAYVAREFALYAQ